MVKPDIKIAIGVSCIALILTAINIGCKKNSTSESGRPNIIFILVDDLGWNGLASYGHTDVSTPNIDRLAEKGMRFTQAYVSPECTPSRAAFLTGQYGARTGMTQVHTNRVYPNAPLITPEVKDKLLITSYTVANMLQKAGYATAVTGKWHVGDSYRVASLKNNRGDQYFKSYGFDFVGDAKERPWGKPDTGKANLDIVGDLLEFVKETKGRPFFAYVSFFSPHTPITAPDSLTQKYLAQGHAKSTNRFGDADEKVTADYLAMVEYLDYSIGTLLERLNERGISDNTMIVFMSDNGGLNRAWNHNTLRGAKGMLYEGGIRVPLIVKWPDKVKAGSQSETPVHIVDMFATFQEIAGGSAPEHKKLDGTSLLPLLKQNGNIERGPLYWHHPHYIHDYGKTPSSAIREGDYKLIYHYGDYLETAGDTPVGGEPYGELVVGERIELYNIARDPGERNNLSTKQPEKAERMLGQLKSWLKEVEAPMPKENNNANIDKWFKAARRN